jgi:hypothetical protein
MMRKNWASDGHCSQSNMYEAAPIKILVIGVDHLTELIMYIRGEITIAPAV